MEHEARRGEAPTATYGERRMAAWRTQRRRGDRRTSVAGAFFFKYFGKLFTCLYLCMQGWVDHIMYFYFIFYVIGGMKHEGKAREGGSGRRTREKATKVAE